MSKIKESRTNNTLTGPFKAPRWIAFGLEDGVPFRRAYRSKTSAMGLKNKRGITQLQVVRAH